MSKPGARALSLTFGPHHQQLPGDVIGEDVTLMLATDPDFTNPVGIFPLGVRGPLPSLLIHGSQLYYQVIAPEALGVKYSATFSVRPFNDVWHQVRHVNRR